MTSNDQDQNVIINWSEPLSGGSSITSYTIKIRHADGVSFSAYPVTCDGSDPIILSNRECSVPVSVLRSAPFLLNWGDEIYAIVAASNIKGLSNYSDEGAGATILTNPDAPLNLANDPLNTSGTTIGLIWYEGPENGGTPVIDYTVSYDQSSGTGNFVELASGVATTSYSATGLVPGNTYTFKV